MSIYQVSIAYHLFDLTRWMEEEWRLYQSSGVGWRWWMSRIISTLITHISPHCLTPPASHNLRGKIKLFKIFLGEKCKLKESGANISKWVSPIGSIKYKLTPNSSSLNCCDLILQQIIILCSSWTKTIWI